MQADVEGNILRVKAELQSVCRNVKQQQRAFAADLDASYAQLVAAHEQVAEKCRQLPSTNSSLVDQQLSEAEAALYGNLKGARKRKGQDATVLDHCHRRVKLLEADAKGNEATRKQMQDRIARADTQNTEAIGRWAKLLQFETSRDTDGLLIKFLHNNKQFSMAQIAGMYRFYQVNPEGGKREIALKFDGCIPRLLLQLRSF